MRLSGMDGFQMLGWRGLCMGSLFLLAWLVTSRTRLSDLAALLSLPGLTIVCCQYANAMLFPLGIAAAPVAPVLLGIATVPIWSALLAQMLYGERTPPATWRTMLFVLIGIALAVSGKSGFGTGGTALIGATFGLGVALALAINFVTLRHNPQLPLLAGIGLGALCSGLTGLWITTPAAMTAGNPAAILLTGLVFLPLAFFCLSAASRHVPAATVSLLMLLETVLGPLWVWIGFGEAPTLRMLLGGGIVILSLALFLLRPRAPLASPSSFGKTDETAKQARP